MFSRIWCVKQEQADGKLFFFVATKIMKIAVRDVTVKSHYPNRIMCVDYTGAARSL